MRYIAAVLLALVLLLALAVAASGRSATQVQPRPETAHVGTTLPGPDGNHCGCVNWRGCETPCLSCCGPNGMDDCFKNPDPNLRRPVQTCCGR